MSRKLRGIEPAQVIKRPKMFWFGEPSTYKTTVALQMPRPYLIDTEQGATNDQYIEAIKQGGGRYWATSDLDEIIEEVIALTVNLHDFKTLIIDPITVPYNDAVERSARALSVNGKDGTEFGRHKAGPDRQMKRLFGLLVTLDMNVVITSHSKAKWIREGTDVRQVGTTFDTYTKLEYLFDLVLEAEKRGKERVATVRKSRIAAFPEGDCFPFVYAEIAKRYGFEVMEKPAEPVELCTPSQLVRLTQLLGVLNVEAGQIERWLEKANAEKWEEMPAPTVQKLILWLEDKVAPPQTQKEPVCAGIQTTK